MRFLDFVTDLFYPPKCVFCGRVLDIGVRIGVCGMCRAEIENLECPSSRDIAGAGFKTRYCDGMSAVYEYKGTIRQSVTRYKFQDKQSYFRTFAAIMAERLTSFDRIDYLVCVPMHRKKERKRGYNQSALLSEEISRILEIPERSEVLVKTVNLKSQSLSTDISRYGNIFGAYSAAPGPEAARTVKNATVLLIDDVITTGSTLNECARALKEAGASLVYAYALATNKRELLTQNGHRQLEKS